MTDMVPAGDYPPRTEAERAKVHFKLSDDAWAALTDGGEPRLHISGAFVNGRYTSLTHG